MTPKEIDEADRVMRGEPITAGKFIEYLKTIDPDTPILLGYDSLVCCGPLRHGMVYHTKDWEGAQYEGGELILFAFDDGQDRPYTIESNKMVMHENQMYQDERCRHGNGHDYAQVCVLLPEGCNCFPDERYQWLCEQHLDKIANCKYHIMIDKRIKDNEQT